MRLLYHLPLSPFSRKVRLVLAEKRLAFDLRVEKPWERRADYLELNPSGSVPTLVEENGLAIPDSSVICEYLEEAYPDTPLLGHTLAERVEIRRLVAWLDGKFAQEVTRHLYGEKIIKRLSAHRTTRRCPRCGSASSTSRRICNISAGWRRRGNGSGAMPCRWPTWPPPGISPRWISAATSTGQRCRRHASGMRG